MIRKIKIARDNVELGHKILMCLPRNGENYYVNPKFISNVEVREVEE